eukprot:Gb_00639 [translate_table: standard]
MHMKGAECPPFSSMYSLLGQKVLCFTSRSHNKGFLSPIGFAYQSSKDTINSTNTGIVLEEIPLNGQVFESQDDNAFYASLLQACADKKCLADGKKVHARMVKTRTRLNCFLETKLVIMYAKCGSLEFARHLFDKMPEKNLVSWTAMVGGYARHGCCEEALKLFHEMQLAGLPPDNFLFPLALKACASLAALQQGKEIHSHTIISGLDSDVFVGSALVDMYSKCGRPEFARHVFDKMSQRNLVSWNAMIAGYSQNGRHEEALNLFRQMESTGIKPNVISWNTMIAGYAQKGLGYEALKMLIDMQSLGEKPNLVTILSAIPACGNIAGLEKVMEIHGYIIRSGFESHVFVESAIVDMYCKCGSIDNARRVFDKMSERDVVSWSSMISGYAMHGHAEDALMLFFQMQQARAKPDYITFIGVLSACSHAGLVDEARQYLKQMSRDYQIQPSVEHYSCMVDLLGRAGHLNEAHELINTMPLEPNAAVWGALLGACRVHCNIDLGERVAEHLFHLEPENAGNYVLLSNIYAAAGRWDAAAKVRKMMKDKGVKKTPGWSWIEVNNSMHKFVSGDRTHQETDKIYSKLENLTVQMKEAGYMPDKSFVLHEVEDPGRPLEAIKNCHVHSHCHTANKYISMAIGKESGGGMLIISRMDFVDEFNNYTHLRNNLVALGCMLSDPVLFRVAYKILGTRFDMCWPGLAKVLHKMTLYVTVTRCVD